MSGQRTYTLEEVLRLLQVSRSNFWRSGLADLIPHERGRWDVIAVQQIAMALARRRALIALDAFPANYPLAKAAEELSTYDDLDYECPECGLMATLRPADTPELMARFRRWLESESDDVKYPAACGWCGWQGQV